MISSLLLFETRTYFTPKKRPNEDKPTMSKPHQISFIINKLSHVDQIETISIDGII